MIDTVEPKMLTDGQNRPTGYFPWGDIYNLQMYIWLERTITQGK